MRATQFIKVLYVKYVKNSSTFRILLLQGGSSVSMGSIEPINFENELPIERRPSIKF